MFKACVNAGEVTGERHQWLLEGNVSAEDCDEFAMVCFGLDGNRPLFHAKHVISGAPIDVVNQEANISKIENILGHSIEDETDGFEISHATPVSYRGDFIKGRRTARAGHHVMVKVSTSKKRRAKKFRIWTPSTFRIYGDMNNREYFYTMTKYIKYCAILMSILLLSACGKHGYEGTYSPSANGTFGKLARNMIPEIVISTDYAEQQGIRKEVDIFVRESGSKTYLVVEYDDGSVEQAFEIIDENTLKLQNGPLSITYRK